MSESWSSEIGNLVEDIIESAGRKPLLELGFTLSELVENQGEHLAQAKENLLASPLFEGMESDKVADLLATAIGADGAREAYQGGTIDDARAEQVEPEDIASFTAESIDFDAFFERRLQAAKEALGAKDISFADEDDERRLRVAYVAKSAYERFIASYIDDAIEI